jgi:hypothetical protein
VNIFNTFNKVSFFYTEAAFNFLKFEYGVYIAD